MTSTEAAPAIGDKPRDVKAAADFLGISPNTLYRLTNSRMVPFHRIPGTNRITFHPADIAEILDASAVRPLAGRAH